MASVMSENGPSVADTANDKGGNEKAETIQDFKNGKDEEPKADIVDDDDDEDDEDVIDDEQLEEYQEMVDQLGGFPDKVKINGLSMVAEDHADSRQSASALYQCIRKPLVSSSTPRDRKLPLVYVLDSILKNVKGQFIPLVETDAKHWMPLVYNALPTDDQRKKLKRVWNMWKEFQIFSDDSWREMGECFASPPLAVQQSLSAQQQAGINRSADGSLKLPVRLRKEMQAVLDDMQSTVENELDKVSLERLADINPDLLVEIQRTAQDVLNDAGTAAGAGGGKAGNAAAAAAASTIPSFLVETRSPEWISRSKEWKKLKKYQGKTNSNQSVEQASQDLISKLQQYAAVVDEESPESRTTYTQLDAIQMTNVLASASVTASLLTTALKDLKDQQEMEAAAAEGGGGSSTLRHGPMVRHFLSIDKSLFTNDGIKKKDETVIGSLYEGGLPFVSSADGKRFATQTELSNHLDYLFKKSRLEKSMERTEERGWYIDDSVWTGEASAAQVATITVNEQTAEAMANAASGNKDGDADPSTFTVPADEARDRCVICGINFKMFFDNENGIYMYNNCREIEVLNDDAAEKESESMLVHVTCWRGLGSPDVLTSDQALQETHHY